MSNIRLQPASPAGTAHPIISDPHPSGSSQDTRSSPVRPSENHSSNGSHVDTKELDQRLKNVLFQLNPKNLERLLMHDPDSQEFRQILDELRTLLTPANVKKMLQGPNAQANAQTLEEIGKLLNAGKLEDFSKSTMTRIMNHDLREMELRGIETLLNAFDGDGIGDLITQTKNFHDSVFRLKEKSSGVHKATRSLGGLSGGTSRKEIDAIRFARTDGQEK